MTMSVLGDVLLRAVGPALEILPPALDTDKARVLLLAIGLQESRFVYRQQVNGPARGFWQFEGGRYSQTANVYQHSRAMPLCERLCSVRKVPFTVPAIFAALAVDDVLAAGMARLALFTNPAPLPAVADGSDAAWLYYVNTWHPGKPHRDTWDGFHAAAVAAVTGDA